jgi:hypothetical protein
MSNEEIVIPSSENVSEKIKQEYASLNLQQAMQKLIEDGKKHIEEIHGFKSAIGDLVQVKGDSENKKELYAKNLQLLDPNIQKMRALSVYNDIMVQKVVEYVQTILKTNDAGTPSKEQFDTLTRVLDTVLILDYLKTWQAGLNNDFSMYRRAIQHVKKDYNMTEDETLRHFLISAHNMNKGLKNDLQNKVDGFEKVLVQLIKGCAENFEKNQEAHEYIRVSVFCVFLIDNMLANSDKLSQVKKYVKLHKTSKLFDNHPRVTMYKDLPMNVTNYLKGCPNFNDNSQDKGSFCPLF